MHLTSRKVGQAVVGLLIMAGWFTGHGSGDPPARQRLEGFKFAHPTWKVIGANEFKAYYGEPSSRIVKTMVLPGLLEILLTVALFWLRPRIIPRWPVALALVLNLARFVSIAVIQIRIREQLSADALSLDAINRLIQTDYLTQAIAITRALLYLWMMSRVPGGEERPVLPPARWPGHSHVTRHPRNRPRLTMHFISYSRALVEKETALDARVLT